VRRTGSIRPATGGSAPVVVVAVAAVGVAGVAGVGVGGVGGPPAGKRPDGAATVGGGKRKRARLSAGARSSAPAPVRWTAPAATSALQTAFRTEVYSAPCNNGTTNCWLASRPPLGPCAKNT